MRAAKRSSRCARRASYTPPSLGAGTILTPGSAGGANWGGAAFDPSRQLMVVNVNRVVQVVQMIPRADIPGVEGISLANGKDVAAAIGTPYGTRRDWLLSPLGAPCTPPPWGELVAVDLKSGDVRWRVPLGSIEKQLPIQFEWNLGTPSLGGPVVTAGGLVFIAGAMDGDLRAFDVETGEMVWRHEMPAGTQATPMTYEADGRQYVVLVTGHHMWFDTPAGDEVDRVRAARAPEVAGKPRVAARDDRGRRSPIAGGVAAGLQRDVQLPQVAAEEARLVIGAPARLASARSLA